MNQKDLAEIKARADDMRALLEYGPSVQDLLEHDVPKLIAEVERLKEELAFAGKCPHGACYEDRSCVRCFGDGTEELLECSECGTQSWHRGGKCLLHDATAPKPYEIMKNELEELRSKARALEEQSSARIGPTQAQIKELQASRDLMREALEYIRPRIGSSNLGESLAKINRALSTSTLPIP